MDDVAEQVQQILGLIQNTRSLLMQLYTAIAEGTAAEVIYAARVLHEARGALAKKEIDLEAFAAAHRHGRREKVTADLKSAYSAGITEGIRRAHGRTLEQAEDGQYPPLRLVRAVSR